MQCFDTATVDDSDARRGRRGVPTLSKMTMYIFSRSIGDNGVQGPRKINKSTQHGHDNNNLPCNIMTQATDCGGCPPLAPPPCSSALTGTENKVTGDIGTMGPRSFVVRHADAIFFHSSLFVFRDRGSECYSTTMVRETCTSTQRTASPFSRAA